jgi:diguanylate cyclase (GGDEF)-like protein/PAS domain S-box-containing protein
VNQLNEPLHLPHVNREPAHHPALKEQSSRVDHFSMWDKQWLEALVANVPGAIYRCAFCNDWEMEYISQGIEEITGYPASDFVGNAARTYASVIHPDDAEPVEREVEACVARREPFTLEYRVITAKGEARWVHEQGRAVFGDDGEVLYLDGSILDISERKRLEAELQHLAHHDALTGLPNRRRLMEELERMQDRRVLVFFDLDGFKLYNDSFGHPEGDLLLRRLARKLTDALGHAGLAFRLGGDEFCVLAPMHEGDGEALIDACCSALSEQGEGFAVTASWGAVILPDEADDATAALIMADQRMYADKGNGRASARQQTRDVVLRVLAERHPELREHSGAVAALARAVGERLGLDTTHMDDLERAAELHDIGKVAIPDAILAKPGPLDAEEWAFMRRHTLIGESVLSAAPSLRRAARIVRSSHERFDGAGYPDGLSGDRIPLASRIVFVCDAFDAMTSDRPYGSAMSVDAALAELARCAGTQFDPAVVEAFRAEIAAGQPAYADALRSAFSCRSRAPSAP